MTLTLVNLQNVLKKIVSYFVRITEYDAFYKLLKSADAPKTLNKAIGMVLTF